MVTYSIKERISEGYAVFLSFFRQPFSLRRKMKAWMFIVALFVKVVFSTCSVGE